MIFVTVGTQLPFPRLIDAMEAFAAQSGEHVVAQTGTPGAWSHLQAHPMMTPEAFAAAFREARVVVGHAGIGTILSATRFARPLVVVPRQAALGEHRNDHQMATARQLGGRDGLHVAWKTDDLGPLLARPDLSSMGGADNPDRALFLDRLNNLIGH